MKPITSALIILCLIALGLTGCPRETQTDATVDPSPITDDAGVGDGPAFSSAVEEVDEFAPPFLLIDTDGAEVTKDDFSGSVLVLDFWATWCKPCIGKLKEYETVLADYRDEGVALLAISLDSGPEVAAGWAKQNAFAFRIAMFDQDFKAAYFPEVSGSISVPQVRVIDRNGNLRYKFSAASTVDDLRLALGELVGERVGGDEAVTQEVLAGDAQDSPPADSE